MSEQKFSGVSWSFGQAAKPTDPLGDAYRKLEDAEALRQKGQLDRARAICESLVGRYPDYFGALFTLGLIFVEKEQFPQALGFLVRAAMLNPRSWRALTALSAVYLELGASEMAAFTLEQAIVIEPNDPNILVTLGEIYREEREYQLAQTAYRKALELDPSLHVAAIGLGSCCSHLGQYSEAAATFEGLIKSGIRSLGVLFELILLPSAFITIDVQAELTRVTREENEDEEEFKNSLAFVSAAILDNAGRHAEAWHDLVPANKALYLAHQKELRELRETETANLEQLRQRQINSGDNIDISNHTQSLFILGPSRSGKTTLESLFATFDGVKLGYENPSVENAIRRTFQSAGLLTTKMFEILPPNLDSRCRDLYLDELARRARSARVFTNTHPARIHDAARIAAVFPNARFIFVKRNIEDNMLRIYMRKYQSANYYSYDLKSIRDHLIWYHAMIDLLAEKLPDTARVVHYEDMVANPAATLRAVAELCGLEVSQRVVPEIGDDRGCALPYGKLMAELL